MSADRGWWIEYLMKKWIKIHKIFFELLPFFKILDPEILHLWYSGMIYFRLETSCMDSSWKNSRRVFLAHLSRKLIGELIVYRSSRRPSVRLFTLLNMNISATSWPIGMEFYLKQHWGWGKTSVCFDPDRIRTLVSMATDNSHRVTMGKTASSRFLECFWSDPFHTCR